MLHKRVFVREACLQSWPPAVSFLCTDHLPRIWASLSPARALVHRGNDLCEFRSSEFRPSKLLPLTASISVCLEMLLLPWRKPVKTTTWWGSRWRRWLGRQQRRSSWQPAPRSPHMNEAIVVPPALVECPQPTPQGAESNHPRRSLQTHRTVSKKIFVLGH